MRYGDDYDNPRSATRNHQATDMMVAYGTPVYAAVGGRVSYLAGDESGPASWGYAVDIAGDDGRDYAYLHLGRQDLPPSSAYAPGIVRGAEVVRGQLIGFAGCSGSASCGGGEHLHFEIHDPNVVDPYDYHDHERIDPFFSLQAAEARGDYAGAVGAALVPGGRFADVRTGTSLEADVLWLVDEGITTGCLGGSHFCPGEEVTRAQMAAFLVRALDLPAGTSRFADVGDDHPMRDEITALADAGVTRGCSDDAFCPSASVTRGQMAAFLVRALGIAPGSATFDDVAPGSPFAADIAALADAGVTTGCGEGAFCPAAPVTRAQMAAFLRRALA